MRVHTTSGKSQVNYNKDRGQMKVIGHIASEEASTGAICTLKHLTFTETPHTDASVTHICTEGHIPAGSIVLGMVAHVDTAVLASSDTWSLGISGATTKWATGIARTAGTTTSSSDQVDAGSTYTAKAETEILMTGSSSHWHDGAGGDITVTIFYFDISAPTI